MDFTLALAHFCELHGPTSLICTQALPSECSTCYASTSTPATPSPPLVQPEPPGYFWMPGRPTSAGPGAGTGAGAGGDADRCASCRMSLPDDAQPSTPLRTREDVHVCGMLRDALNGAAGPAHGASAATHAHSDNDGCHSHQLVYRSSPSPADAESFASMRRATVRTLSGEQLPRGQSSGPLWFGDQVTGYTIAYVFRLADLHARGRQRYYALLALAGHDTTRAFVACTLIWDLFEQISTRIIRSAEAVAAKTASLDESPPGGAGPQALTNPTQITPVSSFLTGRTTDPDGFPRRGTATWRANGIAELVDNDAFFCELHMLFVSMLQELGRSLGGMRVRPAADTVAASATASMRAKPIRSTATEEDHDDEPAAVKHLDDEHAGAPRAHDEGEAAALAVANGQAPPAKFTVPPASFDLEDSDSERAPYAPLICSPGLIDTRQQVAV